MALSDPSQELQALWDLVENWDHDVRHIDGCEMEAWGERCEDEEHFVHDEACRKCELNTLRKKLGGVT